jgi:glycosyltransferase involved in cell wall biosynthesis
MRILMVHNRYLQRGGEDVATDTEVELLRAAGHHVTTFEETNERVESLGKVRTAARTVWSPESRHRIGRLLADDPHDVMHVQNFFPLISPSVYGAARRRGTAVVQTLHNFRLMCPAATLFRDNEVCELCVGRRFAFPGVRYACYRDSRAATAVVASMSALHRARGTFRRDVDVFVTPSAFARDKFIEAGWDGDEIIVKPNCVHPDPGPGDGDGRFGLFVGRLVDVKGIAPLLEAWQRSSVDLELYIVGDGPEVPRARRAAADDPRIRVLGPKTAIETQDLMGRARFLVVPSVLYETFGLVVAEAFAKGTPVIASRLGALPELVDDTVNGLLVTPGDITGLTGAIETMAADADPARMRRAARASFEAGFDGASNLSRLESIYELAVDHLGGG